MDTNRKFAIALAGAWLLQAAVVPRLAIAGIKPDLVLVAVCTFGILRGPAAGAVGGFAGGLLQDMLVPGSAGLGALVMTVVGYGSGLIERNVVGGNYLMSLLTIGSISFVSQLFYASLLFLVGETIDIVSVTQGTNLPSTLYTALIGVLIYPHLSRRLSAERHTTVFR